MQGSGEGHCEDTRAGEVQLPLNDEVSFRLEYKRSERKPSQCDDAHADEPTQCSRSAGACRQRATGSRRWFVCVYILEQRV